MCICSILSCFLSCVSRANLAVIFLWTAGILCSISFVSPFWMQKKPAAAYSIWPKPEACSRKDIGLLAECCATTKCTWVWENGFYLEKNMEDWLRDIQFLFLSGLILLLPVLVISPLRFCCQCGRKSVGISRVFATFTFLSACLCGGAAIYFVYNIIFNENNIVKIFTEVTIWSLGFVIGGVGICFTLASSMFWYLDSKRQVGSVTFQSKK